MKRKLTNGLTAGLLWMLVLGPAAMAVSKNGAHPEGARFQFLSEAGNKAGAPSMAIGPDGSINLIWVERLPVQAKIPKGQTHTHRVYTNLYFARSTDDGRTFSKPVQVNKKDGSVWGFSTSRPKIAIGKSGTIHIFYSGNRASATAEKDAADARYTRSTDGGRTFEPERTLNTIIGKDQSAVVGGGLTSAHCFGSMGVSPDGAVYAFWIDTRHMTAEGGNGSIYGTVSWDDGKTFEPDRLISRDTACPCCQLDVSFSPQGALFLTLRHVYPDGSRNSVVVRSEDGGKTFSPPVRLTSKKWMLNGCPLKPAIITTGKSGWLYAAWYTAAETPAGVYFTASPDGGKTLAKPQAMQPEAKISDHPQIAAGPDGSVYVVWDARVERQRRVYLRVSRDHGKTFGPAREFGEATGSARYPAVAVGTDGTIFLAWQQNHHLVFQSLPAVVAQR